MKKLLIIFAGLTLLAACHKEDPSAPARTNNTQSTLSTSDSLVGDWALRRTEVYYHDTLVPQQTQTYNSPGTCYLNMDSTYAPNTNNTLHQCVMAHIQCVAVNSTWKMTDGRLDVGGTVYDIVYLCADSLVFQQYSITNQSSETRYYFNR